MTPSFSLEPATAADIDWLVQLRVETMRESLERLVRFDPVRSRERITKYFEPEFTHHIVVQGNRVGMIVVKQRGLPWLLDHFYIRPGFQNRGIGSAVLTQVMDWADAAQAPLRLGALRLSDANRFYLRHGFVQVDEDEFDLYYLRSPQPR